MSVILSVVFIVAAYLLGSIPFGLLVTRMKGIDIRKEGSGNIGATNVFRVAGKGLGITTFLLDFLKGFVPAFVFPLLFNVLSAENTPGLLGLFCGCAAIVGHNWPVFLKFKGGKGVATSAGMLVGIAPAAVGVALIVWILLFAGTRYVSVASIAAALAVAVSAWFFYASSGYAIPIALSILAALVIWRHRSNIRRLCKGEENRFRS
ncbi:MAG: glycerol-3-phosphate 1-O-acyltransferase [Spartobacteria bacterium]|nr:glycerol-3-phosphate 1-O-acyltransferase [Spartobacteria bacterium]